MTREVITIGVGGAGIRAASRFFELLCTEHGIDDQGVRSGGEDTGFRSFFKGETQFSPRSVLVDLEPSALDEGRRSSLCSGLFHPDFSLSGGTTTAGNFARGYNADTGLVDKVFFRILDLVEECENLQGFVLFHGVGGGTGSGLAARILERLAAEYRKKSRVTFSIYPGVTQAPSVIGPYNALLATHWLEKYADASFVFDNEALLDFSEEKLGLESPSVDSLNLLVAYAASGVTASMRFAGEIGRDLNELRDLHVHFPRLHFLTVSLVGFTSAKIGDKAAVDVQTAADRALSSSYFLVKDVDFDVESDKYLALTLNFRGQAGAKETYAAGMWLRETGRVRFIEGEGLSPELLVVQGSELPGAPLEGGDSPTSLTIYPTSNVAMAIVNNPAVVRRFLSSRLSKVYDLMYSQRAYVHWYEGDGMEEGTFGEARENIGFLEKDCMDVLSIGEGVDSEGEDSEVDEGAELDEEY